MKILTAEQMRNVDRRATDRFAIPSLVLMENAAMAVVDAIFEHYPNCERVSIFCGTGSNGGDGLAVARHLENRGVVPSVFIIGDRSKFAGDGAANLTICERLSLPMYQVTNIDSLNNALVLASDADVVVDAIFGTGLNRAPDGIYAEVIRSINELALPIVAVDVPSGANASSDEPFDPCVQAAVTVTFAAPKLCHIFHPAATFCGEVLVGPGLRDGEESYAFVRDVVNGIGPPLGIDASGLNAFAGRAKEVNPKNRPRIITPHPGEMASLLGIETREVVANRIEIARQAARTCNCIVVLKGHQTLIADPEGHVNVNPTGNPGMASGGMGDVLGGMIAAFLARGVDGFDAAATAVYLHGHAGDMVKEEMGDTGMAAMDVAN